MRSGAISGTSAGKSVQGAIEVARIPREYPSGEGWVGERVRWSAPRMKPQDGVVVSMASTGKNLAMNVQFDGGWPKLCYAEHLEVIK